MALVFDLYAPISVADGGAEANLLGGASERVFDSADFSAAVPGSSDYFFVEGTLVKQDHEDHNQNRSFAFSGGTITLSGNAPDFTLSFDLTMSDDGRQIQTSFEGTTNGSFRIIEND